MDFYYEKIKNLESIMNMFTMDDLIVAFSGGVDSSVILKISCDFAKQNNKKVYAITFNTKLHPMNEINNSKLVAEELGAVHIILEVDEMENAGINNNPVNRCYLCKKYMFSKLREKAMELGASIIIEGTNKDDLDEYRPGIKALKELEIISPLALVDLTKIEVRALATSLGISASNRPSAPCLATRFPYGTELSNKKMKQVEKGEEFLRKLDLYNVRIRVHENIARIEVDQYDFEKVLKFKSKIIKFLKKLGFTYITLDLEGFRSGSMDVDLLYSPK